MTCLDAHRLFDVYFGDGTAADRAHAAGCEACGAYLRALARDLTRIDSVVRGTTPPRRAAAPHPAWRWAPVAVAAMLALAVVLHRTPAPTAGDDDTLALADEVGDVFTYDASLDGDATGDVDTTERGEQARSTCTWGEPLLGVGCDEPAVLQVAWQ